MPSKARAVWALGLGLVGLVALVAPTSGQDNNAQRSPAPASGPRMAPSVVGCVDIQAVLKGYKKVEFLNNQLKSQIQLKEAELSKLFAEYQENEKAIEKFQPGSPEFKNLDDKLTALRADLEAKREQAQRDLAHGQAQAISTVYKEIQAMVATVAKYNRMTYVLQVSKEPIPEDNPDATLMATMRSVVYVDPDASDITDMVINLLNKQYQPPAGAAAAPAPADPATSPASAPAPNRNAPPARTAPAAGARPAAGAPRN